MTNLMQDEMFSREIGPPDIKPWFPKALQFLKIKEKAGWPDAFGDAISSWNKSVKEKPVTAISLFSGGGGLDIGFHDAGFNIIECNELEPKFAATLQKNATLGGRLHGSRIVCQDVRDYMPSVSHADFIIGGPPCQTFSAAGARANGVNGTDDDRGNLFLEYARILDQIKPVGFLFENVYRIVGAQGGKPWKQIQAAFRDIGYTLHWRILDAADYGVPQFRERLIIVGLREGSYKFPIPTHGPDSPDKHPYYTAGESIKGIVPSECKVGIGGRHGHLLNDIPPGLNYSFYTERMGHPTPLFSWRSKFSDYLYKADPNTPVRTVKAQGGQYTGPFSWENRPFSVEELKRLQTFPDNYDISGSRQTIIHQLGNSVPPQLARVLALSILDQVFKRILPFPVGVMEESQQLKFRSRKSELTKVYASKATTAISCLTEKGRSPRKKRGDANFCITSDLRMILTSDKQNDFSCDYTLDRDAWTISLSEPKSSESVVYSITIKPPPGDSTFVNQACAYARLLSRSCSQKSLLAIWKIYEHLTRTHALKDDLVQLFGYYQYKNPFSISIEYFSADLESSIFWRVIKKVTSGCAVGVICTAEEMASSFGVSSDELLKSLSEMKKLGFEIRNHQTNKQIPEGHILVPYSFPTLNERSLQRLTSLNYD